MFKFISITINVFLYKLLTHFCLRCVRVLNSEPPPLPLTHPPNPFGSGLASPRGTPMKFTTFHQHHQLVAHPQHVPPTNGVSNGNNNHSMYQTQTIHVVNQQHFVAPQQMQPHYHQQQQFVEFSQQLPTSSNYVSNNTYSRMSAPLGMNHFSQQQSPRAQQFWNQQQQYTLRNEFNGSASNIESG